MDRNLASEDITRDILYIILFFVRISIIISIIAFAIGFYLCGGVNNVKCLLKESLLIFGTIELFIGILRFLFFSSFSSGFDAIWTPQMQGEIQRDERERQITGWTRAATGAIMLLVGIVVLMVYVSLFVLKI